ncbi:LytR family transcriptional regulator [Peribacillus frigoritolerans]|jgi:LCP family protein required for cell wall assembly|uniref:polyisoprenyl-teichoic acid--peptidoglycan teichoic acid transferase TagU n=1 Tax=Peribacillus TaxID=2675229 RepID=UPI000557CAD3|nr:LytR family transcriptional regulator [Peribacillus frigoritolerans]MDP9739995.1 LCP family protein required for cell wall assembly [Bacillus sp. B2I3]PRS39070.1 LytR family transcriptional regulator [Bacillus sp. RJGP41]MCK2016862.1 LytR family transcriptional regulator [Peribacillus frigoritolerans]MCR8870992.1 LytR family transcriptional regulator [Peribacillus frigoritolerans]MCY8938733.1 LytR family transcriptional regulator [Peribacillus frigoritolerans]
MRHEKKKKKKRTWLKVVGIIVLLFILAGGAFAYSVWNSLTKTVDTMHTPIDRTTDKRTKDLALSDQEPFSMLMLGVDERDGDKGRSDTMIVLTVNPQKKSVKMLSIPRDTRTEIVGHGTQDKINHAFAFGGAKMSMDTVENFLDIPIDYYMKINMEGFKDIVDAVGGVTVQNDLDFTSDGIHFAKGTHTLNGKEALAYSRMRHDDPSGDFGRQSRQRAIIEAVIKEGASLSSLTKYDEVFAALGNNIQTNLTFDDMMDIQKNYRDASKSITQSSINGNGTKIDGIYYYIVSDEEKEKVQSELKEQLSIK